MIMIQIIYQICVLQLASVAISLWLDEDFNLIQITSVISLRKFPRESICNREFNPPPPRRIPWNLQKGLRYRVFFCRILNFPHESFFFLRQNYPRGNNSQWLTSDAVWATSKIIDNEIDLSMWRVKLKLAPAAVLVQLVSIRKSSSLRWTWSMMNCNPAKVGSPLRRNLLPWWRACQGQPYTPSKSCRRWTFVEWWIYHASKWVTNFAFRSNFNADKGR